MPPNKPESYIQAIEYDVEPKTIDLVVVILGDPSIKAPIKALLTKMGCPSQFILSDTIDKPLSVYSNILK